MKYFSFPLFKENIKRFWGFSAIALVAYFLSSNFALVINGGIDTASKLYTACKMVSGSYIAFSIFDIIVPIICSVLVFGYLSRVNSTGVMHSMPFSRASLYISNYASGLVLSFAPLVLNAIIAILIRQSICAEVYIHDVLVDAGTKYTVGLILTGMLIDLLTVFFTYSIASIAGMISGNSIIHLLTAGTINFILPATWLSFVGYQYMLLDGYNAGSYVEEVALAMHPGLNAYSKAFVGYDKSPNLTVYIIYLLIALALSFIGYILYSHRKLERAGDSYVFGWVKYIVAFFFTYLPATGLALILSDMEGVSMVLGMVIGGMVGFVIGWMIITKSFKIINMTTLKAFLISAGITALIALFFSFDIAGYSKSVPNPDDVENVRVEYYSDNWIGATFEDTDNIKRVIAFHKDIVNRDKKASDEYGYYNVCYKMKNGREVCRSFEIPEKMFYGSDYIKDAFESDEYDESILDLENYIVNKASIEIQSENYYVSSYYSDSEIGYRPLFMFNKYEDNEVKQEILDALIADLKERSFEEMLDAYNAWGYVIIRGEDMPAEPMNGEYISWYQPDEDRLSYTWESTIGFNGEYEHLMSVFEKYGMLDSIMAQ